MAEHLIGTWIYLLIHLFPAFITIAEDASEYAWIVELLALLSAFGAFV
jgi:hypothetical protein